jgi:hypothetical protein
MYAPLRMAGVFVPLRVAAFVWPLRVAAFSATCAWRRFLPLARGGGKKPSDWFPAPSSGQALRPAPVMHVGGSLSFVPYASAANDKCCWGTARCARICSFVLLFFCSLGSQFSVLGFDQYQTRHYTDPTMRERILARYSASETGVYQ